MICGGGGGRMGNVSRMMLRLISIMGNKNYGKHLSITNSWRPWHRRPHAAPPSIFLGGVAGSFMR